MRPRSTRHTGVLVQVHDVRHGIVRPERATQTIVVIYNKAVVGS